jgi:hypothetical protein
MPPDVLAVTLFPCSEGVYQMSTVIDHAVSRKEFLQELAGEVSAERLTQEESQELLKQWDRENPAPQKSNAASAAPAQKLTSTGPKATLMKSPDADKARQEILNRLATGTIKVEEAQAELARVESASRGRLYCKVSAKGALSIYGLQRMPVTLYVEQWNRLLDFSDNLRQFIKEHDSELKRKER